jgi:hypothetical protein
MIARIWHGYTTFDNSQIYEQLLKNEIFPALENKKVKGYRKINLLKRPLKDEVEFITIMIFDNLQAVKDFTGEEYEKSYVPDKAKKVLFRHDEFVQHYEIIHELNYL